MYLKKYEFIHLQAFVERRLLQNNMRDWKTNKHGLEGLVPSGSSVEEKTLLEKVGRAYGIHPQVFRALTIFQNIYA
jgi:hypothetical protein